MYSLAVIESVSTLKLLISVNCKYPLERKQKLFFKNDKLTETEITFQQ